MAAASSHAQPLRLSNAYAGAQNQLPVYSRLALRHKHRVSLRAEHRPLSLITTPYIQL